MLRLVDVGRWGEAANAAGAAVRADPLRESAHATLIKVHLAEGNQSEAVREFTSYRVLLHADLGLEPTPQLCRLVQGLLHQQRCGHGCSAKISPRPRPGLAS
jgi:DNA-binding SARP family transcriptional activator